MKKQWPISAVLTLAVCLGVAAFREKDFRNADVLPEQDHELAEPLLNPKNFDHTVTDLSGRSLTQQKQTSGHEKIGLQVDKSKVPPFLPPSAVAQISENSTGVLRGWTLDEAYAARRDCSDDYDCKSEDSRRPSFEPWCLLPKKTSGRTGQGPKLLTKAGKKDKKQDPRRFNQGHEHPPEEHFPGQSEHSDGAENEEHDKKQGKCVVCRDNKDCVGTARHCNDQHHICDCKDHDDCQGAKQFCVEANCRFRCTEDKDCTVAGESCVDGRCRR